MAFFAGKDFRLFLNRLNENAMIHQMSERYGRDSVNKPESDFLLVNIYRSATICTLYATRENSCRNISVRIGLVACFWLY
jgi:hypothetical protein